MASSDLQTVIDMLKSANPLGSLDIEQMRAGMAVAETVYERPGDVSYEPVDARGVPAEWTAASGADPTKAIVWLHGGGYCLGGIGSHRGLVTNLSRATGARVLNVDYRLAPESPFPAAVDDAVTAYRYVLSTGVEPARVAIGGDSAGGGLTVCAMIALRESGDPLPGAGICISPWSDLTGTADSIAEKADVDPMITPELLDLLSRAYLADADPRTPTASPIFGDLSGLPPLLLQVGGAECLLDDARHLAERAKANGVDVELEEWEDMIHVWHTFADLLPEGRQAIDRIAAWLKEKTA